MAHLRKALQTQIRWHLMREMTSEQSDAYATSAESVDHRPTLPLYTGGVVVEGRLDIGDQVRITGEGTDNEGATGHLAYVDNGALHYVAISSGDDLYGPYTRGDLSAIVHCEWFLKCTREAVSTVWHPIIGDVPVCEPCRKFATS